MSTKTFTYPKTIRPCCNPNCKGNEDGKQMESKGMRGPESEEERVGEASRVEVYRCNLCGTETTFPRFNSPRALFKSRKGRCGEFANLFGTYCRALGFDTRYVHDFTDHVWVEVYSNRQQRWIHSDSCEGLIDRPNMYEQGWGKKLNYAVAATHDSVADVTKRYTRKFYSDDFQARRREFAPDENTSDRIFVQMNGALRQMNNIGKGRLDELNNRNEAEQKFFSMVQSSGVWDVDYREGRISGSLAWKAARKELGDSGKKESNKEKKEENNEDDEAHSFFVESFLPRTVTSPVSIAVQPPKQTHMPTQTKSHPECITVSGVLCAVTLSHGVSIVIIDEASGCILQSKAFSKWSSAGGFLDTVPDGRIVALYCVRDKDVDDQKNIDRSIFSRLGGFNMDQATISDESYFLYIGQINFHPKWAQSFNTSDSKQYIKVFLLNVHYPFGRLRSEINTIPSSVTTRLPETIMPLKTQLVASNYQKALAFNSFMENKDKQYFFGTLASFVGYTTKPGAPVYLIDSASFPFQQSATQSSDNNSSWTTYHFLPDALVPDDDEVVEDTNVSSSKATPKFDIPIADDYLIQLLGSKLLTKNAGEVDTSTALANTRLVALYFSASWCGPCRGFTPLLVEFYNHLKEEVASTHGLEIVFVSSDRDEASFQQYYEKMPFLAMPFSNRALAHHAKQMFGVRGIPSFVVLDSLSGRVVVSPDDSRKEVHQACQRGEQAIESLFKTWLTKVPPETTSMLDILALSCCEAEPSAGAGDKTTNVKAEEYLVRKKDGKSKPSTVDLQTRVKEIFTSLVASGQPPNAAAAEAIKQASEEKNDPFVKLEQGFIQGVVEVCKDEIKSNSIEEKANKLCEVHGLDVASKAERISSGAKTVVNVLSIAKKYVANVQKDPYNPRFRNFKLSNKVFDNITSTRGSIDLLIAIGFAVYHSDMDFFATIPLSTDLELMSNVLDSLIKAYSD